MPIEYVCDMCGVRLGDSDPDRYVVQIEVFASADRTILDSSDQTDSREEIRRLVRELEKSDPTAIEDQTYRRFRFDLCLRCHTQYLARPLPPGPTA